MSESTTPATPSISQQSSNAAAFGSMGAAGAIMVIMTWALHTWATIPPEVASAAASLLAVGIHFLQDKYFQGTNP